MTPHVRLSHHLAACETILLHSPSRHAHLHEHGQVIAEVRILHRAVRFLAAWDKLYAVDNFLASGQHSGRKEVTTALALLNGSLKPEFEELRRRAAQCRETLNEWESVRTSPATEYKSGRKNKYFLVLDVVCICIDLIFADV